MKRFILFLLITFNASAFEINLENPNNDFMRRVNEYFYIINSSDMFICEFYLTRSDYSKWGENLFKRRRLAPHKDIRLHMIGYYEDECLFDMKVVDCAGNELTMREADLCTHSSVTIR
jgi:hypothetical protein